MVKGKYHVSKFGCPNESRDGRASHSQNSILPVAGDTLAGHHGLSLTQGNPGHVPPFHPSTTGSLGFSNAARPPAAPPAPARVQSKGPRIRQRTPPRRKSENLAESTPLTCNEYDTDRPTKPALRLCLCLEITANRAANRTIQLPTHSRRTASHLPADTQADRDTETYRDLESAFQSFRFLVHVGGVGVTLLTAVIPREFPRKAREGERRPKGHGLATSSLVRQPQGSKEISLEADFPGK